MADINKLPKWVQAHIKDLERERDIANRKLRDYLDSTTESKIYVDSFEPREGVVRHYIQSYKVAACSDGVEVELLLPTLVGRSNPGIEVRFSSESRAVGEAVIQPVASNVIRIVNMGKGGE